MGVGVQRYIPTALSPGMASGPVWTGTENLASPGFDSRTVQPVASRHCDYLNKKGQIRCFG
jgi:hypothetical protein